MELEGMKYMDLLLQIPMNPRCRSLNLAMCVNMVLSFLN
jgi:tRNA(Leu) C34 or U34 (ribose-2'-O)-methylase TrmL